LRKKIIFFPIAEGGAKIVGVFRVKNHDFTPKNHYFFQFMGVPPSPTLEHSSYFSVRTPIADHQRLICEKQDLNYLAVFWWLTVTC